MYDVVALGELLIDFACLETDGEGYPTMASRAVFFPYPVSYTHLTLPTT